MNLAFSSETWNLFKTKHPHYNNSKIFKVTDLLTLLVFYLDDVLLMTCKTWGQNEHFILLEYFFWVIEMCGLKISLKKSEILVEKTTFLGQSLDLKTNTTYLDEEKTKVFRQWRRPLSTGELISRLSILNYYSKYITAFKIIAFPLFELVKKKNYTWETVHEYAWQEIKFLLAFSLKLTLATPESKLILFTDASFMSISYVLMEVTNNLDFNPIMMDSKLLRPTERNYSILRKEALSMIHAVSQTENYIRQNDNQVILFSDCNSLQYLKQNKNHNSKLFQHALYLSSFHNLQISHIAGKYNSLADLLSRTVFDTVMVDKTLASEILTNIVIPVRHLVDDGKIMNSHELNEFIMNSAPSKYVDILPHKRLYTIDKEYFKTKNISSLPPESELLFALQKLSTNDLRHLNSNIIRDFYLTISKEQLPKDLLSSFLDALKCKLTSSELAKIYPLDPENTEDYLNKLTKNCPNIFDPNCKNIQDPLEQKYKKTIYLDKGQYFRKNHESKLNKTKDVKIVTLDVQNENIFPNAEFINDNKCEGCKTNSLCIYQTNTNLNQLKRAKESLNMILKDKTISHHDENFLHDIKFICFQNIDLIVFYLQTIIYRLMLRHLDSDGSLKIPIFWAQNSNNRIQIKIKNHKLQISLKKA